MGKKGESNASQLILQSLQSCSRTKKELKRAVKAARPSVKKKYTKRALKDLLANGKVQKNGKEYKLRIEDVPTKPTSAITSQPKSILSSQKQIDDETGIPIGMKLRESKSTKGVRFSEELDSGGDIDDEIARLERELMEEGNDSDDSGSSSEDETSDTKKDGNGAILSLSSYADDKIETLPSACLPVPGKYSLKKKKKSKSPQPPAVKSGLQKAVEEVLSGYTARSSEKIPFYCRFCSKQYEDEESFFAHKSLEFHETAVALERKATYCKLCRKQFTSPIQMKEHLASRPHKQRLQDVRSRQRGQRRR